MAKHHPETYIVKDILQRLHDTGLGDGFHVHGSILQRGGEPDISGELYSKRLDRWLHLKIEVKVKDGYLERRQASRLRNYWKRGYLVGVVSSFDELMVLINIYEYWCSNGGDEQKNNSFKKQPLRNPEIYDAPHQC